MHRHNTGRNQKPVTAISRVLSRELVEAAIAVVPYRSENFDTDSVLMRLSNVSTTSV